MLPDKASCVRLHSTVKNGSGLTVEVNLQPRGLVPISSSNIPLILKILQGVRGIALVLSCLSYKSLKMKSKQSLRGLEQLHKVHEKQ